LTSQKLTQIAAASLPQIVASKDLLTLEGSFVVKNYMAVMQDAENLNQRIKDFEQGYMRAY